MRLHPEPNSFATITQAFVDGRLQNRFYQKQHRKFSLFFSDEGIFHLSEKGLSLIEFHDSYDSLNIYTVDKYDFLVDKSYYSFVPFKGGKLPLQIDEKCYELFHFKTSEKSPVTLHIVKEHTGVVTEVWFEFQDSLLLNPSIKEDIYTFLTT